MLSFHSYVWLYLCRSFLFDLDMFVSFFGFDLFLLFLWVYGVGCYLWLSLENEVKMESFLSPVWLSGKSMQERNFFSVNSVVLDSLLYFCIWVHFVSFLFLRLNWFFCRQRIRWKISIQSCFCVCVCVCVCIDVCMSSW